MVDVKRRCKLGVVAFSNMQHQTLPDNTLILIDDNKYFKERRLLDVFLHPAMFFVPYACLSVVPNHAWPNIFTFFFGGEQTMR